MAFNRFEDCSSPFGFYAPSLLLAAIMRASRHCSASWVGKRCAFVLRALGLWLLAGKPVDCVSLGARLRLWPFNNVCEKRILFTPQYFDAAERALLHSHLKANLTGDLVFLDVGANIGGYSLFLSALAGPQARILAIEPQPDIFNRLVFNIQQTQGANVKALDCALSERNGHVTLFVNPKNQGETSMRLVNQEPQAREITVAAKTLLTLMHGENLNRLDAIKLDVEGAEDLILEPFFKEAPKAMWPGLLLLEYGHSRRFQELARMLGSIGYREVLRTKSNVAFVLDAPTRASFY